VNSNATTQRAPRRLTACRTQRRRIWMLFEAEWRKNLFATALERMKPKFSLKQFQMFDLHALK
jgi:hypothetical protein